VCLYRWQLRKWPLRTRCVSRITVKTGNIQYYSISLPCRQGAVEEKVWIRTANKLFFRLRNRQKLVRIRFENIRYISHDSVGSDTDIAEEFISAVK
jgi:hypothetical protein